MKKVHFLSLVSFKPYILYIYYRNYWWSSNAHSLRRIRSTVTLQTSGTSLYVRIMYPVELWCGHISPKWTMPFSDRSFKRTGGFTMLSFSRTAITEICVKMALESVSDYDMDITVVNLLWVATYRKVTIILFSHWGFRLIIAAYSHLF